MKKNFIRAVTGITGVIVLTGLCTYNLPIKTAEGMQEASAVLAKAQQVQQKPYFGSEFERKRFALKKKEPLVVPEPAAEQLPTEQTEPTEPAVEPEVQPAPEPNEPVKVAAAEPEPEPEPTPVPVVASVEAPGGGEVTSIAPAVEVTQPPIDNSAQMASIQGGCSIMGTTFTYLEQMVRYYNANQTYPAFYAGSDAPTIEAFCQIYIEEAQAEGVRAEVAFCQAMKETGFLRYAGDVRIEQYNFAGIGATGDGEPGNSFGNVRMGVRAQIQHLKAYASNDKLNGACVDPRFSFVKTRGSAPLVEWLGIHENPFGGGWAAAENYGPSIVSDYLAKLFSF